MQLKKQPTDRKEYYKKLYGANWEFHYNQWKLFNTKEGAEQRAKYVNWLETKE